MTWTAKKKKKIGPLVSRMNIKFIAFCFYTSTLKTFTFFLFGNFLLYIFFRFFLRSRTVQNAKAVNMLTLLAQTKPQIILKSATHAQGLFPTSIQQPCK